MTQRQDVVLDQDLKNGLGSLLEFVAHAIEIAHVRSPEEAKNYLKEVSRDIITGKGHPAPNPGPVTPLK